MNKIPKFISCLLAFVLLVGTSCTTEIPSGGEDTTVYTSLYAGFESVNDSTKAVVNTADGKVSWENGDQIFVHNGSASAIFTYDTESGKFKNDKGLAAGSGFVAYYPASAVKSIADGVFSVTLPATQEYSADLVKSAPMSASSTTDKLVFKNLCGILKLQLSGSHTISSIVFTANGKAVAGDAQADASTGVLTMSQTTSNVLTLNINNVKLGSSTPFYVVVPAQLYSNGFSLVANATDGVAFSKSTDKAVAIPANTISAMKAFDAYFFSGGCGTVSEPYLISKEQDLIDLSTYTGGTDADLFRDKCYKQTDNIHCTASSFNPICPTSAKSFTGVYDGNHKYIYDLNINKPSNDNVALFGCMSAGEIKNVHPAKKSRNYNVSGKANVGAIVGRMAGGKIRDCGLGGVVVTSEGNCAGILVGYVPGPDVEISGCSIGASCSVRAKGMQAGAVAGKMMTGNSISNCEIKACSVSGTSRVGGVVGYLEGNSVVNACACGALVEGKLTTVANVSQVGGIVGYVTRTNQASERTIIINCIYANDIYDNKAVITVNTNNTNCAYVGGIVGAAVSASDGASSIEIVNCFANPWEIRNTGTGIKGFAAILGGANTPGVSVVNCYSPAMLSCFNFNGTAVTIQNYGSYTAIGSAVGSVHSGMTINGAYGKPHLQLYDSKPTNTSNVSNAVADPSMKNFDDVVYRTDTPHDVDSYSSFKEALDAGAKNYNDNFSPVVQALTWSADVRFDGFLKPDGVAPKSQNVYKRISIIGDSLSSYRGFGAENQSFKYNAYYPNSWGSSGSKTYGDVLSERETWWWKLIYDKMTNSRLEFDNAFSGSTCCWIDENTPNYEKHQQSDYRSTDYCAVDRYRDKGVGYPDVLILFIGSNDYSGFGDRTADYVGDYDDKTISDVYETAMSHGGYGFSYRTFTTALSGMISQAHYDHPDTKFLVLMNDWFIDPFDLAAENVVKVLSQKGLDIKFVSFHERGTQDKTNTDIGIVKDHNGSDHPSAQGCTAMADYIYEQVGTWLEE